jgi:hypothetical protein
MPRTSPPSEAACAPSPRAIDHSFSTPPGATVGLEMVLVRNPGHPGSFCYGLRTRNPLRNDGEILCAAAPVQGRHTQTDRAGWSRRWSEGGRKDAPDPAQSGVMALLAAPGPLKLSELGGLMAQLESTEVPGHSVVGRFRTLVS